MVWYGVMRVGGWVGWVGLVGWVGQVGQLVASVFLNVSKHLGQDLIDVAIELAVDHTLAISARFN